VAQPSLIAPTFLQINGGGRFAMKTEATIDRDRMAERTSSQIFGLALTAVFVGMLVLNAISN
jgi:hypothetical protein